MKRVVFLFVLVTVALQAAELPKAKPGFKWQEFSKTRVTLQVPDGWQCGEKDNRPAQTIAISPDVNPQGGYDSGFTLNAMVCHSEKEWRNAYLSSIKLLADTAKEIKGAGKPTFEKTFQDKNKAGEIVMQMLVIEGDMMLPNAPHPKEKYRVRTILRAFPPDSVVYVYTIGALVKDWDEIWKIGETMLESIIFRLPNEKTYSSTR